MINLDNNVIIVTMLILPTFLASSDRSDRCHTMLSAVKIGVYLNHYLAGPSNDDLCNQFGSEQIQSVYNI